MATPTQLPDATFVQLRFDLSLIVEPSFRGVVEETMVKVMTRHAAAQVADYWPRTELYSSIDGRIDVVEDRSRWKEASVQGFAGYPGIGTVRGEVEQHDRSSQDVRYREIPPQQLLIAAGTIGRSAGVYYKFKASPHLSLEGGRTLVMTLEVPASWRGDVLEVHATAYGRVDREAKARSKVLLERRFLVATYREGDTQAAEFAVTFVQQHRRLLGLAAGFAARIDKRAYPTPVHKLGQVLDIYQPQVADDYLEQWIFGASPAQPNPHLPVDLRVAMLDFLDSRIVMERLAQPLPATHVADGHSHLARHQASPLMAQ